MPGKTLSRVSAATSGNMTAMLNGMMIERHHAGRVCSRGEAGAAWLQGWGSHSKGCEQAELRLPVPHDAQSMTCDCKNLLDISAQNNVNCTSEEDSASANMSCAS